MAVVDSLPAITQYVRDAIDTVLTQEPCSRILENAPKDMILNFDGVGYVRIFSILTDGLSNYYSVNSATPSADGAYSYRQGAEAYSGFRRGNVAGRWQLKELRYKRAVQLGIDHVTDGNMANMAIANTVSQCMRTRIVPEIDEQRFSTIADNCYATLGNLVNETEDISVGTSKITKMFDIADEWLFERGVQSEDVAYFVSPHIMTALKNDPALAKYLIAGEFKTLDDVTFQIMKYNGHPIEEVPASRFYTHPTFGENGFYPSADSRAINFIACDIRAVLPVKKIEFSKIYDESTVNTFYGWLWNYLMYYDTIIPENKVPAMYCDVAPTAVSTKGSLLELAIVAGSAVGTSLVKGCYTLPGGINGTLVESATAFTLGATATISSTVKVVPTDSNNVFTQYTPIASSCYFALIDGSNKVVATVANAITMPVGA